MMKKYISLLLCITLIFSLCACGKTKEVDLTMFDNTNKISYCNTYSKLSENGEKSVKKWREGIVSGNGRQGVVTSGAPYDDTFIFQNIDFILPSENYRGNYDITADLDTTRQAIINHDDSYTDNREYLDEYCYHAGALLRVTSEKHNTKKYIRYTDYEKAEVVVSYSDKNGDWERRTFTSFADDATITKITGSENGNINLTLSIDDISNLPNFGDGSETDLRYKKLAADDCSYIAQIAHYPSYENSELKNGGYATVTYIITQGGSKEKVIQKDSKEEQNVGKDKNPAIKINDAQAVYLITVSDRTHSLGTMDDFEKAERYDFINTLYEKCKAVGDKYTQGDSFNYAEALKAHADIYTPEYNAVSFSLGDDANDKSLPNEKLIKKQRHSKNINQALAQRAYYSGRYAQLCCSGYSIPRLYGMWVGEWNAKWNAKYTMDANVNLQTAAINSGNISFAINGFINFILRQANDWMDNAKMDYGAENAIQVPVNTDGDNAVETESNHDYPFQYWNAGAAWMIEPLYEYWQSYGNTEIPLDDCYNIDDLKNILDLSDEDIKIISERGYFDFESQIILPLLTKAANFWQQILTPEYYTDSDGNACYEKGKTVLQDNEKYLIIPSYSPENIPSNSTTPLSMNSAMDISAAKQVLTQVIDISKFVNGDKADVSKWESLLDKIPDYLYDETGALKEWCVNGVDENNTHRHLSHLYCAWPLTETQNDKTLQNACLQAVANRASENKASHALVHRALICARLKDNNGVTDALTDLMTSKIYYYSLMTNHHMNAKSAYCTDFAIGYDGIVNEALVYSDIEEIEILTALPNGWIKGSINGILTKAKAQINIKWNENKAVAEITSNENQTINISCGVEYKSASAEKINIKAGETATVEFVF